MREGEEGERVGLLYHLCSNKREWGGLHMSGSHGSTGQCTGIPVT